MSVLFVANFAQTIFKESRWLLLLFYI